MLRKVRKSCIHHEDQDFEACAEKLALDPAALKRRVQTYSKGMRQKLVETLVTKGINNEHVLNAINKIPRHLFMDSGFIDHAYVDKAFPIGADQTISQPYTVAFQSELLQVQPDHKILEIGTGSGYQTAVLLELGAKVYSIERQQELFKKTSKFLPMS